MDNDDLFGNSKRRTLKEIIEHLQEDEFEELKKNPVWAEAYKQGREDAEREWQMLAQNTVQNIVRIYGG